MSRQLLVQQQFLLVASDFSNELVESSTNFSATISVTDDTQRSMLQMVQSPLNVSVPAIYESELQSEYTELADALAELACSEDVEWKIDDEVKDAALFAAANLWEQRLPAPKVFTHGGSSVVFNWSDGLKNLYLTISSDKGSALISTPQRIERRWNFALSDLIEFPGAQIPLVLKAPEIRRLDVFAG